MQSGASHKPFVLSLLFFFVVANCAYAANRLVINEVMINEPGSETSLEWVELFNAAEDSVNLIDYIFIEAADTTRFAPHWLQPRDFVVLSRKPFATDNSASFERQWGNASNIWGDDSLENYLLLPVKMSLRNSNDSITIIELSSGTPETVKWGSTPPDGVSLERVNPMTHSVIRNFKYCNSPALSTPGRANSVVAKIRDWGFIENDCEIFVPPDSVHPVQFQLTIGNFGQSAAVSLSCDVVFDRDFSGTLTDRDSLFQFRLGSLSPDSVLVRSLELSVASGRRAFIFHLASDDDSTDNTIYFECVVGPLAREMLITEFICNDSDSSGCEWIELQSVVDYNLSLQDWTLAIDDRDVTLADVIEIRPTERIILCEDSSCFRDAFSETACQILQPDNWHALGNAAGDIVLRMQLGAASDTVSYHASIEPGRSWERDLDSNSMIFESQFYRSTSLSGGTPCGANSIRPAPVAVDISIIPGSLSLTKDTLDASQIIARLTIENRGYLNSQIVNIGVFDDSNFDNVTQESELISQQELSSIPARDSVTLEISISPDAGRHNFIFALSVDDIPLNSTIAASISVGPITHELIVTEFLANPEGELETEWLEITNISDYPIDLLGWQFGDALHQSILNHASVIMPGEYCILAQEPAAYTRFYETNCPVLSCRTWSNLNNSGDIIIAYDEFGTLSDSVTFVRVAEDNRSMELNLQPTPGLPEWNPSIAISGSTPCAANSSQLAPFAFDIGFIAGPVQIERDSLDESIAVCRFALRNFGYRMSTRIAVDIFDDLSRDGIPSAGEFLITITSGPMSPGDTSEISYSFQLAVGRHSLIFQLADDEDPSNNVRAATVTVGPLTHEIIITEFLAGPEGSLETEWIEIRNVSEYSIDLTGWTCGDRTSLHPLKCSLLVPTGDYLIIAQDSAAFVQFYGDACRILSPASWSSLNNSGDAIILRDEFGTVSDSLTYIDCPGDNRSLERNETGDQVTASWYPSTAQTGSTPCAANSVSGNYTGGTSISLLNRVFSPLAGEELRFKLECPPASKFTIEIFDLSGRRQHVVADAQYFSSGEFSYDGVSDHAGHLSIGAYILKIESEDAAFSQKVGFAVAPPK